MTARPGAMPPAGGGDNPPTPTPAAAVTQDDVQKMIRDALAAAPGPAAGEPAGGAPRSGRATAAQQGDDISAQVAREVEKIRVAEATATAQKAVDERLKAIEETTKKIADASPVRYRKITLRLWGDRT